MTTTSAIITAAYREGNLIPVGTEPTLSEQTEALGRLNAFIKGVFGHELGEALKDWLVPAAQRTSSVAANFPHLPLAADPGPSVYTNPPKNTRIVFGGAATQTVYFPEAPQDGSRMALIGAAVEPGATITLDGNGRLIEGAETQSYAAPFAGRQWFYRADICDWRPVVTLAAGDEFLFPDDLDDFFITGLMIRLSPRYGKEPSAATIAVYKMLLQHFKNRYRQAGITTHGAQNVPNAAQSYRNDMSWFR